MSAGPMRVALFGLGAAAAALHLPACARLPDVSVVAGCDPDGERREWGRRAGIPALYERPEDLLDRERPDIVIVATPPDSHGALTVLALEQGAHVFCEKPFVPTVAEADLVLAAAGRRRRAVMVNNQYGLMPIYRIPRERIEAGEFGRPFLIQCWQQMDHPPARESNWRTRLVQSTLLEFGTHPLDLICGFFGALPVAIMAQIPRSCAGVAADVVVQATLRFPGDRLATLLLNRASQALERYLEMRIDCERASLRISFGGVAGAALEWSRARHRPIVRLSLVRGGEARVEAAGRSRTLVRAPVDGRPAATADRLRALVDLVRRGTPSTEQARHAREMIRLVNAGYESARTGETVWLDRS